MVRLERSQTLRRMIRKDDLPELGVSTLTKALEAIEGNRLSEAEELVKYLWQEWKGLHDLYAEWVWALMDRIAARLGEEEMYKMLRSTMEDRRKRRCDASLKGSIEEGIQLTAEFQRAHRSGPKQLGDFVIRDEGDKYVIELDPCGSGGKNRRPDPIDGTPARTEAPYNLGTVEKAYPWTWSKPGVARYCVHCCINEIIEVDYLGYPVWIHEYPDNPEQPCRWLFYKDPKSIPEKYFARIGKAKKAA